MRLSSDSNNQYEISLKVASRGKTRLVWIIGTWILSFDLAQDGEFFDFAQDHEPVEWLVEPFVICILEFGIFYTHNSADNQTTCSIFLVKFWNLSPGILPQNQH